MEKISLREVVGKNGFLVDGDWVKSKDQDPNGEVRLIQLADIGDGIFINKSNRFLTLEKAKELKCTFLEPGDLLVARMPDPIGRACIFPYLETPCVTVVDVCIIRVDNTSAINTWLKFLINNSNFRREISQYVKGATRQRISRKNLESIRFNISPLPSQIRIAKVLSWAEELIEDRRKSIDLLDDLLRSTFLEMFGDPVRNEKGWEKKPLKDVCTKIGSGATPSGGKENYKLSGISLIRSLNIHNNRFKYDDLAYIDETQAKELENVIVEKNDVLINITGASVTRCCIVPNDILPARVNQHVSILRFNPHLINHHFACHALISENFQKFLYKRATQNGATREALTKSDLEKIRLIQPRPSLQNQFAEIVELVEATKKDYKESLDELENLYASLSQLAFRGDLNLDKLDVQKELEEHNKRAGSTKEEPIDGSNSTTALHTITSGLSESFTEYGKLYETIEKLPKLPLSGLEAALSAKSTLQEISRAVRTTGVGSIADSIIELQKQNEKLNRSISPFLPSSSLAFLIEAQKHINKIIGNDVYQGEYFTPRQVINTILETWEAGDISFNTQRIAKILTENFTDYHFNFEMALNCIKQNLDEAIYYSTEELLKEPGKTTEFDLNKIFSHALLGKNPFLRLKQHFYNAEEENFNLKIRDKDYASFKSLRKEDRSGIYFGIG